jgi:hypothetical protein
MWRKIWSSRLRPSYVRNSSHVCFSPVISSGTVKVRSSLPVLRSSFDLKELFGVSRSILRTPRAILYRTGAFCSGWGAHILAAHPSRVRFLPCINPMQPLQQCLHRPSPLLLTEPFSTASKEIKVTSNCEFGQNSPCSKLSVPSCLDLTRT